MIRIGNTELSDAHGIVERPRKVVAQCADCSSDILAGDICWLVYQRASYRDSAGLYLKPADPKTVCSACHDQKD